MTTLCTLRACNLGINIPKLLYKINQMTQRWSGEFFSSDLFDLIWKRPTWQGITKNWPLVEVKALREEHELFLPLLEKVACSGHLGFAGVLADAGKVHLLFLHVVTQPNVVEVRRDVDQSVWHNRILVLRKHFVYKELKPIHKIGENNQSAARTYMLESCERKKTALMSGESLGWRYTLDFTEHRGRWSWWRKTSGRHEAAGPRPGRWNQFLACSLWQSEPKKTQRKQDEKITP